MALDAQTTSQLSPLPHPFQEFGDSMFHVCHLLPKVLVHRVGLEEAVEAKDILAPREISYS